MGIWRSDLAIFRDYELPLLYAMVTNSMLPSLRYLFQIEQLMGQEVVDLPGKELQRVALPPSQGEPTNVCLIDEPSRTELSFMKEPHLMNCVANAPQSLRAEVNFFFSHLTITFRRDPTNFQPRINKLSPIKDREQKFVGSYYYLDD
ncbi:ABC transporter E family member 2-like [Rutidosis leptorrhynchoides]|uniref:ABC transporter E family member 2-like n=1 Tax=Rutidosis leptorrhynchoides TaxID=125765 RepID=UPI003A9A0DBB